MALDLSTKNSTLPLDLSTKSDIAVSSACNCSQELARVRAMVRSRIRNVRFLSSVGDNKDDLKKANKEPSQDSKLKISWSLKRRLHQLKRKAEEKEDKDCDLPVAKRLHFADEADSYRWQRGLHPEALTSRTGLQSLPEEADLPSRGDEAPSPQTPASLPKDPREWDRTDVQSWIHTLCGEHNLPEISPDKFLMNGKALCLMSLAMFLYRVPEGGRTLYIDFRARLAHAIAVDAASEL